jgi:hypothetical protein
MSCVLVTRITHGVPGNAGQAGSYGPTSLALAADVSYMDGTNKNCIQWQLC